MSNLFVYDINTYLQADSQLQTLMNNNNFIIYPARAYDDESAPFIVWTYKIDIRDAEMPWWRVDTICYDIYDTDADRCLQIGERIINIINIVDKIDKVPSYNLGQWCFLINGEFSGPEKRDGWYAYSLEFEASHLPG